MQKSFNNLIRQFFWFPYCDFISTSNRFKISIHWLKHQFIFWVMILKMTYHRNGLNQTLDVSLFYLALLLILLLLLMSQNLKLPWENFSIVYLTFSKIFKTRMNCLPSASTALVLSSKFFNCPTKSICSIAFKSRSNSFCQLKSATIKL